MIVEDSSNVMLELVNQLPTEVFNKYRPGTIVDGHKVEKLVPIHVWENIWMLEVQCSEHYRFYIPDNSGFVDDAEPLYISVQGVY